MRSRIIIAIIILFLSGCKREHTNTNTSETSTPNTHAVQQTDMPHLNEDEHPTYTNTVVGLLPRSEGGSFFVSFDTDTWEPTTIKEMPNVTPDNYAAISSDSKYIAYTTWIDDYTFRYLVVENTLTGEVKAFYQDMSVRNEIIKISFMPDDGTLLLIKRDASIQSYEEIHSLNIETGEDRTLVKGEVWQARTFVEKEVAAEPFYLKGSETYLEIQMLQEFSDEGDWGYYLMQDDIDEICTQYGGQSGVDMDNVFFIYVEFSAPRCSADGTKILYSATLCRNSAPQGTPLWLASAVWLYDMSSGESAIIFATDDNAGIGRADWTADDNNSICFVTYYDNNGGRDSINYYDLSKEEHTVIFPYTDEHFNNVTLLPVGNNKLTFTSSSILAAFEESDTILYDISNGSHGVLNVTYDGDIVLLRNFIYVRYILLPPRLL